MSLGLIPAILSQTRRTLTKTLRLDTDYTTVRATNLDNLDVAISTVDSKIDTVDTVVDVINANVNIINANVDTTVSSRLSDVDAQGKVTSGLDVQGYTTTRASNLDNLNATVASRMSRIGITERLSASTTSAALVDVIVISSTNAGRLNGVYSTNSAGVGDVRMIIDGTNHGTYSIPSGDNHLEFNDGNSATLFQVVSGSGQLNELNLFFKSALNILHGSDGGATTTTIIQYEVE